jgi:hypothetical protein
VISQTWLSFIGFSDRAVHEKRYIFDRDDLYSLAFLHRTRSHGAEYNFDFAAAREDWIAQAPSPKLMLVSFLSRALAQRIALSARENREKTCKRLAIDPEHTPKEEIDHMCGQDEEFLVEQILSGMTFVFTDVFGYILYKAIGERVHDVGHLVLQNGSLDQAHRTANYDEIAERIRKNDFGDNDLLPIGYSAFRHVIEQMTGSAWRISYQTARTRSRFNHSAETRRRIYRELDQLDQFMKRTQLTRPWAVSIPAGVGLYGYFKKALS